MPQIDAAALLAGAEAARSRPEESAATIAAALEAAPNDIEVRLAAYRFYFYNHDYTLALDHAWVLLSHAARQLNVAQDWRAVAPGDAEFQAHAFGPGLYLQALIAVGYCCARTGDLDLAREVLEQAARLDPSDRFGGAWLLGHLDMEPEEEEA